MSAGNETCPAELPNWCAQRHWGIFWILILASVAVVAARVLNLGGGLEQGPGQTDLPFFSANDRSRWITVRALVDHGTFEIDPVLASQDGRQWDTIDKVRLVGGDGQFHFYSSKPPLLSVLMAGGYWGLKQGLGWEISTDTQRVVSTLLMLTNVLLWGVFLWFAARMINSVPVRDWARYFVLACAGFATFLSSFTVTLNNHLPAAVMVMMALYFVSEIIRKGHLRQPLSGWYFAATGFAGAWAVAFELPALAFLAMLGLLCFWQSRWNTLLAFLPAASSVLVLSLSCNAWAWGEFKPAYGHRTDGVILATVSGDFDQALNRGMLPFELQAAIPAEIQFVDPVVEQGKWPSTPERHLRWVVRDFDPRSVAQIAIVSMREGADPSEPAAGETLDRDQASQPASELGQVSQSIETHQYQIHRWDNWYDYPGSYWLADSFKKSAIDQGQPDLALYAFHLLFGHHGIFSLTPLWLLSFAGMLALLGGAKLGGRFQMRWLGCLALLVTLVVIGFYLSRPTMDRNYGGVCCVARWLLWLVPIWLMAMLPVVDWLGGSRWGKAVCLGLMLISACSALVHASDPWTLPWLYQLWDQTGLPL